MSAEPDEHTMQRSEARSESARAVPGGMRGLRGLGRGDAERARRRAVTAFFDENGGYGWWRDVYAPSRPRGFFSHEMVRRRDGVLELLSRHARLGPGARVLECGCGPGGQLAPVAATGCATFGIDLNLRSLAEARTALPRSSFARADVEALPFRSATFDAVVCVGVLPYLREDEPALRELARVVKPDGVVVVSFQNFVLAAKLLDPYYWLVWLPVRAARAFLGPSDAPDGKFHVGLIRKHSQRALCRLYSRAGLLTCGTANVSFGPLTLWRREVLPLAWSAAASDLLATLAARRTFSLLGALSNHWVTALARDAGTTEGGRPR